MIELLAGGIHGFVATPIQSGTIPAEPIHYSTVFDGRTPCLCGRNEIPKPASDDWAVVTCPKCLDLGVAAGSTDAEERREELGRAAVERDD